MIRKGLLTHHDLQLATIKGRQRGASEIDWLLTERRITPQELCHAATSLVSDFDAGRTVLPETRDSSQRPSLRQASEALSSIIGESDHIKNLKSFIQKIAPTGATVLIHGESGTGKELVARGIHRLSPRAEQPFLALNCSAVPSELIESELFGHKKGAFTGAISDHIGVFRAADRGTLFIDEIDTMSPPTQAKLLRALQLGEIKSVGDPISSLVDVRFVCATNSDLQQLVNQGQFRQDLLFRISVFEIFAAPLRERPEDIPLLINHFLGIMSATFGGRVMRIDPPALELLCKYPWPGNVRELQNEIQRAFVMAGEGSTISVRCFSEKITKRGASMTRVNGEQKRTLKEAVETLERDLVQQALNESGGKRNLAARLLGLSRQGLVNKIQKYKISLP